MDNNSATQLSVYNWLSLLVLLVPPIWTLARLCCVKRVTSAHKYIVGQSKPTCFTGIFAKTLIFISPIAVLMPITVQSTITGKQSGPNFTWAVVLPPVFLIVLLFAIVIVWPILGYNRANSVYQYLEDRYQNAWLKRLCAFTIVCASLVFNALLLGISAQLLITLLPTDKFGFTIEVWMLTLIIGVVFGLATFLGGQQSVIDNMNIVSVMLMLTITTTITLIATYQSHLLVLIDNTSTTINQSINYDHTNIWTYIWQRIDCKTDINQFFTQSPTLMSVCLCCVVLLLNAVPFNQVVYQQYQPFTIRQAQKAFLLPTLLALLLLIASFIIGVALYSASETSAWCTTNVGLQVRNGLQLMPRFMDYLFRAVFSGEHTLLSTLLATTCTSLMVCAVIGIVPAGIMCIATVVWEDFMKTSFIQRSITAQLLAVRCVYLAVAFTTLILAALITYHGGATGFVSAYATILLSVCVVLTPVTAVYLCGMFMPCANAKGAFIGLVAGLGVGLWLVVAVWMAQFDNQFIPTLKHQLDGRCPMTTSDSTTVASLLINSTIDDYTTSTQQFTQSTTSLSTTSTSSWLETSTLDTDVLYNISETSASTNTSDNDFLNITDTSELAARFFQPQALTQTQLNNRTQTGTERAFYHRISLYIVPSISLVTSILVTLLVSVITKGQDIYSALDWNLVYGTSCYISCSERCDCCVKHYQSRSVNYNPAKICVPSESFKYAHQGPFANSSGDELESFGGSTNRINMKYSQMDTLTTEDVESHLAAV